MYRWALAVCVCTVLVASWLAVTDSEPTTTEFMAMSTVRARAAQDHQAIGTSALDLGGSPLTATAGDVVPAPGASGTAGAGVRHERIVAYYGVAGEPGLGVVGTGSPDAIAAAVTRTAAAYRGFGERVRPAIELVATMAQATPGRDGDYSTAVPASTIQRYLDAAHRHHILLILDLQPGHASFLTQARSLARFLVDPSVALGLDTEWRVTSGAVGHGRVGSTTAREINQVGAYLSGLVRAHHLPQKMMLIHQFRLSMLPDRSRITQHGGVWVVLHDDGFGTPSEKVKSYNHLQFPRRPFGAGFKVFLHKEPHRMTARQVMALNPRPDVITYQ